MKAEAANASDKGKAALNASAKELEKLADDVKKGTVTSVKRMEVRQRFSADGLNIWIMASDNRYLYTMPIVEHSMSKEKARQEECFEPVLSIHAASPA